MTTQSKSPSLPIFKIDRSVPFDPVSFIGAGWTVWRGPIDGNGLEGDEDQDPRSLTLLEIDLSKILFVTGFKRSEGSIHGEENLKRLGNMSNILRLDAKVFQTLWEHCNEIPEDWKRTEWARMGRWGEGHAFGRMKLYTYCDGTILRDPNGRRQVLYLSFDGPCEWCCDRLDHEWSIYYRSAVLARP